MKYPRPAPVDETDLLVAISATNSAHPWMRKTFNTKWEWTETKDVVFSKKTRYECIALGDVKENQWNSVSLSRIAREFPRLGKC